MNSANQMAEEIYGLHCDIGRLEKLVKHWKTEFIDEQDYAKMMELEADKAKAENAKLRKLLLYIADMLGKNINLRELCEESANLRAENAGLRKLLLDVWSDAIRFDDFWDYVMDDGELYNKDELPHYQERMRELGIEVNV